RRCRLDRGSRDGDTGAGALAPRALERRRLGRRVAGHAPVHPHPASPGARRSAQGGTAAARGTAARGTLSGSLATTVHELGTRARLTGVRHARQARSTYVRAAAPSECHEREADESFLANITCTRAIANAGKNVVRRMRRLWSASSPEVDTRVATSQKNTTAHSSIAPTATPIEPSAPSRCSRAVSFMLISVIPCKGEECRRPQRAGST